MSKQWRPRRRVALAVGLSLVAVACSDDGDTSPATDGPEVTDEQQTTTVSTQAPELTTASTDTPAATSVDTTVGRTAPSGDTAMTVTIDLNPDAVWEDGSPITVADLECTWRAYLNTPGSITTAGYDKITAVSEGDSDRQAVIEFNEVYAPYRGLFNAIIKAAAVDNCDDISRDFQNELPISGRPLMLDTWSAERSILVPNPNYWGDDPALSEQVVMVPQADQAAEVAAIVAGELDFIYPRFSAAMGTALQDPNVELDLATASDFEGLYFQQLEGPFADRVFREAFSKSIDRQALFDEIYAPIFESAGAEGALLDCGPMVEGPYCPEDNFQNTYDPAGAVTLLTENGWSRSRGGFWAKDGEEAPTIMWMVDRGNAYREKAQEFLIPALMAAGFDVVADNDPANVAFEQRLPTLDWDLAMYRQTQSPDPTYLVPEFTCENIPTEENNFEGRNSQGWCDEAASNDLHRSDVTVDEAARVELVRNALRAMDEDDVMLPLVNYPQAGAWRTDKVGGPIDQELANYRAFGNLHRWEDLDGDGRIVIGAEQWPRCLNPVTECADSLWYAWSVSSPTLPGVWAATSDQRYEPTNLVVDEPTVELAE